MGYSVSWRTHCSGDDNRCDDTSLIRFAAKRAAPQSVLEYIVSPIIFPIILVSNLVTAPFLYKCPNSYIRGTPEYKERISKIKVYPNPRGFGVIIDYSDCKDEF